MTASHNDPRQFPPIIPLPVRRAATSTASPELEQVSAQVRRRLARLPLHADAIADFLHTNKITGVPQSAHICPISRYLAIGAPPGFVIRVDEDPAEVQVKEGDRSGKTMDTMTLPPAAVDFIRRFDRGEYPRLQGPGDRARTSRRGALGCGFSGEGDER